MNYNKLPSITINDYLMNILIANPEKTFFEDAAPVPDAGTFGRARKTKQSPIASFSALLTFT